MELSSSEMKTIQHQYDALAKKVLKGEAEYIMILPYRHSPSVQSVAGNG